MKLFKVELPFEEGTVVYFFKNKSIKTIRAFIPKEENYTEEIASLTEYAEKELKEQSFEKCVSLANDIYKERFDSILIQISLGDSCNFECDYCCIEHWKKEGGHNLTPAMINKIPPFLDTYVPTWLKGYQVVLTGGEPTHPKHKNNLFVLIDLFIQRAKEEDRYLFLEINTNGFLVNQIIDEIRKREQRIKEENLKVKFKFMITIDGLKDTHNARRKYVSKTNTNTFDKIIENIKLLLEKTNAIICIRTNIDKIIYEQLEDFWSFLISEEIISKKWTSRVEIHPALLFVPKHEGIWSKEKLDKWSNLIFKNKDEILREILYLYYRFFSKEDPCFLKNLSSSDVNSIPFQTKPCELGLMKFIMIQPNGDFSFCNELVFENPPKFGNLLDEIYDVELLNILTRGIDSMPNCKDCDISFFCGGLCPLVSLFYSKNVNQTYCEEQLLSLPPKHAHHLKKLQKLNPNFERFVKEIIEKNYQNNLFSMKQQIFKKLEVYLLNDALIFLYNILYKKNNETLIK